ncbi:MAG: GNAT family N-acetyltransferase [Planctomycetota bacterium]|jgi:ribosomal protein S18 acetylase RimI-like enzyme
MPVTDSIESVSLERWRTLAPRFLDYSYQQCWAYAQALALRHHAASEHVAIVSGAEVLGLASVRVRTAPVLKCGIAYIASGPLTRRGWVSDIDRLGRCLRTLQEEYVERRGLVLRILAPLGSPEWNLAATAAFKEAGMTTTDRSRSYRTFLLDVSRTPDVIRTGCSKYWRRNLRRADRAKFTVHIGTTPELFDPMRSLYEQLRRRKQFESALDADFYAGLQPQLDPGEQFTAGLIEMDGEPVAGLVWSMLGDTCVPLLLAADESGLLSYAVYLLQWRSIVDAHERGMRYYDLGGIDPETNVGVYNFKKGLRGLDLWAPGPFEAVPSIVRGVITHKAEDLYRCVKQARRPDRRQAAGADALEPALPASGSGSGSDGPKLRRAKDDDVEKLMTICRGSFPNTLRWQVGGAPARGWWGAALPSPSCETWVSVHDDDVQGFVVLVTDERTWAVEKRTSRGSSRQWLSALLTRPWKLGAHLLYAVRQRARKPSADTPRAVARTPQDNRTWVELIAVAPRYYGQGVAADLLQQAESRTRELDRRAVQLTVRSTNGIAIRRYARSGYGLVQASDGGLILGKRMEKVSSPLES